MQRAARGILEGIFKEGYAYAKAGIMLFDLIPQNQRQATLIPTPEANPKRRALMAAMDRINGKFGKKGIRFGAEGLDDSAWRMQQQNVSPRFTTEWKELAQAKCR